jgi:hypothetical protein
LHGSIIVHRRGRGGIASDGREASSVICPILAISERKP